MDQAEFLKAVKDNRRYANKAQTRWILDMSPLGIACFTNNFENGRVVSSDREGVLRDWEQAVKWCDGNDTIAPLKAPPTPTLSYAEFKSAPNN